MGQEFVWARQNVGDASAELPEWEASVELLDVVEIGLICETVETPGPEKGL